MRTKMNDGDNVNDDDDHVDIISLLACCKIKSVWAFTFTFQNYLKLWKQLLLSSVTPQLCCLMTWKPTMAIEIQTEDRPYSCPQCDLSFKMTKDLKMHMIQHGWKKSHSCNLCGYSTTSASKLKRHMLWFTEANPAWLWDFLRYEIEKGLRVVQFTLERSLLLANSATSSAHRLGA